MMTEAINTIEVYAVHGQGLVLEPPLVLLANELKSSSGCISYHVVRSSANADLWIVTGQWVSKDTMEDHYAHPALNELMKLLSCHSVNRIAVSSFVKSSI